VARLGRHTATQGGLTLVELLIAIAVLATLSTIALLWYMDVTERAKIARAVADITTVGGDIDTFELSNDRLPNDLAEIGRASLRDPWGRHRGSGARTTTSCR
jgi:general secretion pathway protein G